MFGPYLKECLLGTGGMGQVWSAFDTRTNRRVALKVLPVHLAEDPDFRRRFHNEAAVTASLNEPHIVPIHSWGDIDGQLYIDMALIEGRDLAAILLDGGPMPAHTAVDVITQAAEALDTAHAAGLTHRDVKPSNLLVTSRRAFVYLIDFGIAHGTEATRMTTAQSVVGSLAYMAPERFGGEFDARSDQYSLACVLYECLTGRAPFGNPSPEKLIHDHLSCTPPRVSGTGSDVPAAIDEVITRGMAKNPDDRYAAAGEFAAAASAALHASVGTFAIFEDATAEAAVDNEGGNHWMEIGLFFAMLACIVLGEFIRFVFLHSWGALALPVGLSAAATIALVTVRRARRQARHDTERLQVVAATSFAALSFYVVAVLADYYLAYWFACIIGFVATAVCAVTVNVFRRSNSANVGRPAARSARIRAVRHDLTSTTASPSAQTIAASAVRVRSYEDEGAG